jgi:hypothetical protein
MAAKKHQIKLKNGRDFMYCVYLFMAWLDDEMKKPSTADRGMRVAKAMNSLELNADRFAHFDLAMDLDVLNKMKRDCAKHLGKLTR